MNNAGEHAHNQSKLNDFDAAMIESRLDASMETQFVFPKMKNIHEN